MVSAISGPSQVTNWSTQDYFLADRPHIGVMLSSICSLTLKALGWKIVVDDPGVDKYLLIVAPHTSNWDFPLGVLISRAIKLKAHFIAKHTVFRKPFGWIFRSLGGIPVYRGQGRNLSDQMAEYFRTRDHFILAITPEGTRSKLDHWKTGFYHIARAANVPVVMGFLDYGRKEAGIGGAFMPSGSMDECFEKVRAFYADRRAKKPENTSLIRPKPL